MVSKKPSPYRKDRLSGKIRGWPVGSIFPSNDRKPASLIATKIAVDVYPASYQDFSIFILPDTFIFTYKPDLSMLIKDIIHHLESKAPLSLQESYDNAGLLTGDPGWECTGILCSLDATE